MIHRLVLTGLIVAASAGAAVAQAELERFERQIEQIQRETRLKVNEQMPADQRMLFDYGGSFNFGYAAIDDSDQRTHNLFQYGVTVFARLDLDQVHQFFVRGSATYRDFGPGESFDGHGDEWIEPNLERGTYRFDLARAMEAYEGQKVPWAFAVQGGRQLVHWANGLVLSKEIDGGVISLGYDQTLLDIVAGVTRDTVVDFDSSRPNFNTDTRRLFFGGKLGTTVGKHRPYVYGLVQLDRNNDEIRIDRFTTFSLNTDFRYDSWYLGWGSNGEITDRLVYGVELAYEGGISRSNSFFLDNTGLLTPVGQSDDPISAFAMDLQLDYVLQDPNRTRMGFGATIATGDEDRLHTSNTLLGNQTGTTDEAFNAFGLINTGLAFSPAVSNMLMFRMGASTFPLPNSPLFNRLQLGANFYVYNKLQSNAPIDEPSRRDVYLGCEPDVYANWQVTSDVSVAVRYGVFFPGQALFANENPRHFVYSGITLAF